MNTTTKDMTPLGVVAVEIGTSKVLWTYATKGRDNAEATIKMAVMRQGCDDRFFTTSAAGKFKTGDDFKSDE